MVRRVLEQEGHRLVDLGRGDHVIVVEHEQPVVAGFLRSRAHELVHDCGQQRRARRRRQCLHEVGNQLEARAGERGPQIGQETRQGVVTAVQGEPRHPSPAVRAAGGPLGKERALAEPCRRGDQGEPVPRSQRVVQHLEEARACHHRGPWGRRKQLGGEQVHDPGATGESATRTGSKFLARSLAVSPSRAATERPNHSPGSSFGRLVSAECTSARSSSAISGA